MAFYTPQEKKDFILKDMKNAIGLGVGNAFSKAVDYILSLHEKTNPSLINSPQLMKDIFETRDQFFASNQQKIHEEFQNWLKQNEDEIDSSLGIQNTNPTPL